VLGTYRSKVWAGVFTRRDDRNRIISARRTGLSQKRVNVDIPAWMVASLDKEAERIGVSRQSVIKMWLFERIQAIKA